MVLLIRRLCNVWSIVQPSICGLSLFAVACLALLTLRRWETLSRDSVATPTRLTLYVPRTSSLTTPYRSTWLEGRWPHLTYWIILSLSWSKYTKLATWLQTLFSCVSVVLIFTTHRQPELNHCHRFAVNHQCINFVYLFMCEFWLLFCHPLGVWKSMLCVFIHV